MSYFQHELTKCLTEEIERLSEIVLRGNCDPSEYIKNTAMIYAYRKVINEFFNDAETAMNQEKR